MKLDGTRWNQIDIDGTKWTKCNQIKLNKTR